MDRNKDVLCYAVNAALGETVVEKHSVAVLCKYQNVFLSAYQYNIPLRFIENYQLDNKKGKIICYNIK